MSDAAPTPNHQLAAVMREAGVSNKGLAKRMRDLSRVDGGEPISPSHTNVDKWLSGATRHPQSRTCHVLAKVLTHELGRPVTLADIGYGETAPEGADFALEYPETLSDSITALIHLAGYELADATSRRKLHVVPEAWASLLNRWMFGSDTEPPQPIEPRPISEMDVQAVHEATRMFANFDYRYGGGRPKPLVARYLETDVLPLIPHVSPATPLGRRYFQAVAALTRLAGWTAYDTGQHALAQRYLYQAFRLARAAGDKALCGRVLAGMSHQANFLGHYEHAVHLARAAAHGASGHATPAAMALFHAMEARALASQGNEIETTSALTTAERWHSQSQPTDEPEWMRYFDSAELHAEFAHCFRDLGQPELSNLHAVAAVGGHDSLYVRSQSFCRTVLATAHLQANDLEHAVETARVVVDAAAELKSYRVLSYLDDFRSRLAAFDGPAVREFTEYVALKHPSKGTPAAASTLIA